MTKEKEIDPFYILGELKSLKDNIEQGHLDTAEIEVNQLVDTFQSICDEKHRIYLERAERYMGHVDSALKDKE